MFEHMRQFLDTLFQHREEPPQISEEDTRLAVAALLYYMINVDGFADPGERERLRQILAETYALEGPALEELMSSAKTLEQEAVDLYQFTSRIKRCMNADDRRRVVEMMWQVAYADGEIHALEDNTVWRVAELLGISARDRLSLQHKVMRYTPPRNDP